MKYLKKFNEELKSSTYKSAGEQLTKIGHKRRGTELLDYSDEVQFREKHEALLRAQRENKEFGLFDITLFCGYGERRREVLRGEFYLQMVLESDWFKDSLIDWVLDGMNSNLSFYSEFALIPKGMPQLLALEGSSETQKTDSSPVQISEPSDIKDLINNNMYDYRIWTNRLSIEILQGIHSVFRVGAFEDRDRYQFSFNSRADATRFKTLLIQTFEGNTMWSNWRGKSIHTEFKETLILSDSEWESKLTEHSQGRELNLDGLQNPFSESAFSQCIEAIKKMSLNGLYID